MLAVASGCVGMSVGDFERCTPSEFTTLVEAWQKHETALAQRSWEQARFIAMTNLQPYSKKALKPTDIVRFDWDEEKKKITGPPSTRKRMEEVIRKIKRD